MRRLILAALLKCEGTVIGSSAYKWLLSFADYYGDDSFGVMRFYFDLILTQFCTRNWVKNESKLERITPNTKGIVSGKVSGGKLCSTIAELSQAINSAVPHFSSVSGAASQSGSL